MPPRQMLLTFPIQYLEMVEAFVCARGGDVQRIYQDCGLSLKAANDPETRLSISQFVELMQFAGQYLDQKEPASKQFLRYMPVTMNGTLGMAAMCADNLRDALDISVRYFPLIMPCVDLQLENRGNKVYIRIKTLITLGSPFDETLIEVVTGNILRMMARFSEASENAKQIAPALRIEVHFQHNLFGNIELYEEYCDVSIKSEKLENQLILPREILNRPFSTRNRTTRIELESILERKMQLLHNYNQVTERTRRLLSDYIEDGNCPDVTQIAEALTLSTRTLNRRLAEEGYTLSQLIADVRMERAEMLLTNTVLPLFSVAKQVGYSDLSAFSRAFKRVKGQSPSELRISFTRNRRL